MSDDDDAELLRQAQEEILLQAKRGKERASEFGATSWKPCPVRPVNKRFLSNMLSNSVKRQNNFSDNDTSRYDHKTTDQQQNLDKPKDCLLSDKRNYRTKRQSCSDSDENSDERRTKSLKSKQHKRRHEPYTLNTAQGKQKASKKAELGSGRS